MEEKRRKRTGRYLNEAERYYIEVELAAGTSISGIARKLGRSRRTIQREIRRGSCEQMDTRRSYRYVMAYKADHAQMMHERRQSAKGTGLKIGHDLAAARTLRDLIVERSWSPAAALGYAREHGLISLRISVPTVYSYVHKGVLLDVEERHLPQGRARRRKEKARYRHAHHNVSGTSIELRPEEVAGRKVFGHWEGDLIVGKQKTKAVVLTLVERKTRFVITKRLETKQAFRVVQAFDALEAKFGELFCQTFKSVTFDNGSEFQDWERLERSVLPGHDQPRTAIYYAHPYCSSERGSNENCNRMLRRAGYEKGSDLGKMSGEEMATATAWVNDFPRRPLGYRTAREAFAEELSKLKAQPS